MNTRTRLVLVVAITLSLLACSAIRAPLQLLRATPTPSPTKTLKVKRTKTPEPTATLKLVRRKTATPAAAVTSNATLPFAIVTGGALTPTLAPTSRPARTRTATPTAPEPTEQPEYGCRLSWQSPSNQMIFYLSDEEPRFGAGWDVINTGLNSWDPGSVYFTYVEGAPLANDPVVQLTQSVAPGDEVVLSVGMKVPKSVGKYTTRWALRTGSTAFCPLFLTITVED